MYQLFITLIMSAAAWMPTTCTGEYGWAIYTPADSGGQVLVCDMTELMSASTNDPAPNYVAAATVQDYNETWATAEVDFVYSICTVEMFGDEEFLTCSATGWTETIEWCHTCVFPPTQTAPTTP